MSEDGSGSGHCVRLLFGIPAFAQHVFHALFGVYLQWLPVAGYAPMAQGLGEHLRYLALPALSLGVVQAGPTSPA